MTITHIRWHALGGRDIHLIPGLVSPRLIDMLDYYDDHDGAWLQLGSPQDEPNLTMTFTAKFKGAPSAFGVDVASDTGEVTVKTVPAGARPRSFLIIATGKVGSTSFSVPIRIWVHASLTRRWLTPTELTVRQGATNMRYSVFGQFDDMVIGDITNWGPMVTTRYVGKLMFVHPFGSAKPVHAWSLDNVTPAGSMTIDPVTGELAATVSDGGATAHVVDQNGHTLASAPVHAAPSWSTSAQWTKPVQVVLVAGTKVAGGKVADAMTKPRVRNVLFLPDGFVDNGTDRDLFQAYVRKVVNELRTNVFTRPFDLFADNFNYFMAWVPSPQAGVAPLNEFFSTGHVTKPDLNGVNQDYLHGWDVPLPVPPANPLPATMKRLEELVGAVGLPSLKYEPAGTPLAPTTDNPGLAAVWQQLYDPSPTIAQAGGVFAKWLQLNTHILINERNTAFHTASFDRPRADMAGNPGAPLRFHPLRLTPKDFNAFLSALQDDAGNALPPVWAAGGRDEGLAFVISRTQLHAGTDSGPIKISGDVQYITATLDGSGTQDFTRRSDGNGYDLRPDDVPGDVSDGWATAAHELSHSLRIEDEYGGRPDYVQTSSADTAIRSSPNVQTRADLLVGGELAVDKIKWRWPRIKAAGILADMPAGKVPARLTDPSSVSSVTLTLMADHWKQFQVGDIIRLRLADLLASPTVSSRMRVTAIDSTKGELTADQADYLNVDPAHYPSGSVVLVPARAPDTGPGPGGLGNDLLLVANSVADRITATHNPLDALPTDPANRPRPTAPEPYPTPASNFLGPLPPGVLAYQVVGLYDGGATYDAGAYHPSGSCLMIWPYEPDGPNRSRVASLCPVCRYAMVDLIDPTQHRRIDIDYGPRYPA